MSDQETAAAPPEDRYEEEKSTDAPGESGAGQVVAAAAVEAATPPAPLFSDADRAQFDADDVTAGSHIGKMLAIFFLYTVAAMSIVAWWTYRAAE